MATIRTTVPPFMRRLILFAQIVWYSFFLSLVIGLWPQKVFAQLFCSSTQITPTSDISYGPSITADGTRIAFTSDGDLTGQNPDGSQETFVFNTTNSTFTQITNTTNGFSSGRISGDGNYIAFIAEFDPNLFLFNTTNNTTTKITNIASTSSGHVGLSTLSADGSRIAFDSNADVTGENPNGNTEIFLFDRTTNTITQITHTNTGTGVSLTPWISADGTRITFYSFADHTGGNPDHNYEIFLFNIGTNTLTQITHTSGPGVVNQRPTANANGRLIAFDSNANLTGGNPGGAVEIFLFNTLTNTFRQITNNLGLSEFATINANGTRIVFQGFGLSLFDLPTNSFTQLTDLATGEFAAIDADGNRIAVNLGNKIFLVECVPTDTWTQKTAMTPARFRLGAATAPNGKIYAIGGTVNTNGGTVVARNQEYDPGTDSWTIKTPMTFAREVPGITTAQNGKIYAIGGRNASGTAIRRNEEYDPIANAWTEKALMPTARANLGLATASNGKIYAVGGTTSTSTAVRRVEEYDPNTNIWTPKSDMRIARSTFGLVAAPNGKLYAIGGIGAGGGNLNSVEEYDPNTDTWTDKANMPTARRALEAVLAPHTGKIYAMGGVTGSATVLRVVQEYDPDTDTWTPTPREPMPIARYAFGLAALPDGRIYAIGGGNQVNVIHALSRVDEYIPPQ